MASLVHGGTGPDFGLENSDLEILAKFGKISSFRTHDKISGEIILTDENPNEFKYSNGCTGLKDGFSSATYFITRKPKIIPDNYKGIIHYKLKIQRERFFEDVKRLKNREIELIAERCMYDRFHIILIDCI